MRGAGGGEPNIDFQEKYHTSLGVLIYMEGIETCTSHENNKVVG